MIIPWEVLTSETLHNIIESFVLREGTDYGENERTLAEKVLDVKKQLECGDIYIIWSELNHSLSIVNKQSLKMITAEYQE